MAQSQTPTQNIKIIGKTCGSTLGRSILNAGNVAIANVFRNIGDFFTSIGIGTRGFNGWCSAGGVVATNAVTFSSIANNDTVTLNGVVLTAKTAGTQTGNNQFSIGTTDTLAAANLAALINSLTAPAKIAGVVNATSAAAVVTINAIEPGVIGNLYTLAISAHGSVTGANFASGTDGTLTYISKGL